MTTQTYPSGKVIGYAYDDKGELVSISIDGTPFISNIKTNDNGLQSYEKNATDFQNFVYDANGNRLNQEQENNETKLFTYALNSNILNSIKESNATDTKDINYEYDKTGNIIKDDKHTYTYDSRNRLTAIDNNVTYQYNYDNKRVSKTVNGVKTYFIYDGHKLIGDYKLNLSNDSRQEYVYLNSTPIATITPKETYRVYADHLDTSRRVATNNEEAKILWKWESKPFGESKATGDINFNLRFPGQYFDTETSTHYNINRDYNPVTGRYIQSDPIGFGYVGGMPLIRIDSLGLVDLNFFSKTEEPGLWWAAHNTTESNSFSIAGHGGAGYIIKATTRFGDPISDFLYIDSLTELLKNNGGYKSRNSITLLSCNTGAIPTDGSSNNRSLAQQLANNLDINVIAPVGKCYYIENYRAIWMVGSTTFYPEVKLSYWDTFLSWFS